MTEFIRSILPHTVDGGNSIELLIAAGGYSLAQRSQYLQGVLFAIDFRTHHL